MGNYTVTVSGTGFATVKVNKVTVSAGVSYTLPVKLAVAAAAQSVEVTASAPALDTVNLSIGREKRYPLEAQGSPEVNFTLTAGAVNPAARKLSESAE